MARQMPAKRTKMRMDAGAAVEASVNKVSDLINTGVGNALGGIAERAILGGRQSTGTVKFSETPVGKKRAYRASHKGLAVSTEF